MAKLECRLDEDSHKAFVRAYPRRGERNAVLRRAIQLTIDDKKNSNKPEKRKEHASKKDLMARSPTGRKRFLRDDRTVSFSMRLTVDQYLEIEKKKHTGSV